jgi:hypothetical protein
VRRALGDVRTALGQVFVHPAYLLFACALAAAAFLLAVWFPNLGLISEIFWGSSAPLAAKLGIVLSLLGGIVTNFSLLAAAYTVVIAILFGVITPMIAYLLWQRRIAAAGQNIALGTGAVASGVLGVGCAACGSLVLGAVFPSFAAAGALAALPLQGEEFGILSVVLLFVSLLFVSRNIAGSVACPVAPATRTRD